MSLDADALVIGAGPAGASTAILLAGAGWRVILIEQHRYPRRKVCGECLAPGTLASLDALGVGASLQDVAGPELRQLGWMGEGRPVIADMPVCTDAPYRYGRALGRQYLDTLLLERARSVGVQVLQPARMRKICGGPGRFECEYEWLSRGAQDAGHSPAPTDAIQRGQRGPAGALCVRLIVDARGSWGRRGQICTDYDGLVPRTPGALRTAGAAGAAPYCDDLLAFKASFRDTNLPPGLLLLLPLAGAYGGMVVSDHGRTTVACCVRRDVLDRCRRLSPDHSAGEAIETYLHRSGRGICDMLGNAHREGPWLAVGPVRPGICLATLPGALCVGNAAGSTQPLTGEGIGMAIESAILLADQLSERPVGSIDAACGLQIQRAYSQAWRRRFAPRLRFASICAHIAMRPWLAAPAGRLLRGLPGALTFSARLAGKARHPCIHPTLIREAA